MTSLNGPGFSITLLKATQEMLEHVDAPTKATGWSAPSFPPSLWEGKTSHLVDFFNGAEEEDGETEDVVERKFAPHQ
jgi:hypothetical protein